MGVPFRVRRTHASLALAIVAALAGSATAATGSNAAPSVATPSSASPVPLDTASPSDTATALTQSAPASVTPAQPLSPSAVRYEPAVHISASGPVVRGAVRVNIADVLLHAYRAAADGAPTSCNLPVSLLAAIGQVESGSLVGRPLDAEHRTSVLGPVLNGNGFSAIRDTDQGKWDGDATWDRAVGPMQFIPGTWEIFGADGDGDGKANPQDVEDAAAATAAYLCYGGRDLAQPADRRAAIFSYNHSQAYLDLVTTYQQRYAALGLDDDVALTGLPTDISLAASPVASYGGASGDTEPAGAGSHGSKKKRARAATDTP